MKKSFIALLLVCALAGAVILFSPVNTMAKSAVALAARQMCSLHFGSGLSQQWVHDTYVSAHVRPVGDFIDYRIDAEHQSVRTSLLGFSAKADVRQGYGCTLDHGVALVTLQPQPLARAGLTNINIKLRQDSFVSSQLEAVIAAAFDEPEAGKLRNTVAVLVLHKGQLVAEKYAPGIDQQTPLPGFSMAKSMTATMMALLVQHKDLDIYRVVSGDNAMHANGVSVDNLLRMNSGIKVQEDGSGADENSIMLTGQANAAAYALNQGFNKPPGEVYAYTGGGPVLLAKLFNDLAADDVNSAYVFLVNNLLQPLQLDSVVLEADAAGTFLGSSFMLASALDWAKLGQLYLQDGVWAGRQILPTWWSDYVKKATAVSGDKQYGAGFWSAENGGRDSKYMNMAALPRDAYFMHGMMNQGVYILPSQQLVIVRLGATRSYQHSGELDLVTGVMAAMR